MKGYEKVIRKRMIDLGITFRVLADDIKHPFPYNLSKSIKNNNVTDKWAVPMYDRLDLDAGDMYKLKIQDEND